MEVVAKANDACVEVWSPHHGQRRKWVDVEELELHRAALLSNTDIVALEE